MLFAFFDQHNRNAILDWIPIPVAAIDQPIVARLISHQLDWSFVGGIGQNLKQFRRDRTLAGCAKTSLRASVAADRSKIERAVFLILPEQARRRYTKRGQQSNS